jgi:hypothetical protein
MQKSIFVIIIGVAAAAVAVISSLIGQDVYSQNMPIASNLTRIENDSSSTSVTARSNISAPLPESENYLTPSPTDQ